MRAPLRPFTALARLLRFLLKRTVQLTFFSAIGTLLLFVLDLALLRDRKYPDR